MKEFTLEEIKEIISDYYDRHPDNNEPKINSWYRVMNHTIKDVWWSMLLNNLISFDEMDEWGKLSLKEQQDKLDWIRNGR